MRVPDTSPENWTDYIDEPWEAPAELRTPNSHTETNLTVQLLSCPALNLDRQAARFLVEALAQHDYVVQRRSRETTDPQWFARQYMVGQFEQQRIFDALQRFRELENSELPDAEVGALRRARRRDVELGLEAAIAAYEAAMSEP